MGFDFGLFRGARGGGGKARMGFDFGLFRGARGGGQKLRNCLK